MRTEQWNVDLFQYQPLSIQHTSSSEFSIAHRSSENCLDMVRSLSFIFHLIPSMCSLLTMEMNFQFRTQKIYRIRGSSVDGGCCTCMILWFAKKILLKKYSDWLHNFFLSVLSHLVFITFFNRSCRGHHLNTKI